MKNFFSSIFKAKSDDNESIISFKTLNEIYSYLYYQNPNVNFKIKGFYDKIYLNRYNFPESFDNPKSKSEVASCNFNNIYHVLNSIYSKIDIEPLSEELFSKNSPVDFIHVQFFSTQDNVKGHSKNYLQNFVIFFSCENGSTEVNNFRILYSINRYFTFFIRNLLDMKYIPNNAPAGDIESNAFKDFETVLMGICQYLNIELPKNITDMNILQEEVTQENFIEFLNLVTRNSINDKTIKKIAKKGFDNYKNSDDEYDYIENNYELLESINCWNCDWKFESNDVVYFISEILDQDFSFDFPADTFNENLFPYIQSALEKYNFELMSFDTQCDDYLFFIANKSDVKRIMELSEVIEIQVQKL